MWLIFVAIPVAGLVDQMRGSRVMAEKWMLAFLVPWLLYCWLGWDRRWLVFL